MNTTAKLSGAAVLVYRHPGGKFGWGRCIPNGVTYQGVNWLLDTGFGGIAQVQPNRCGLIASTGYVGVSSSDTHGSHAGWLELASITSLTRPTWTSNPASGGTRATTIPAHFTFVGSGYLRGVFLASVSTLGSLDPSGILYNTAVTYSPLAYADGGTLDVSFTPRLRD